MAATIKPHPNSYVAYQANGWLHVSGIANFNHPLEDGSETYIITLDLPSAVKATGKPCVSAVPTRFNVSSAGHIDVYPNFEASSAIDKTLDVVVEATLTGKGTLLYGLAYTAALQIS